MAGERTSSMNTLKRVIALVGAILVAGIWIATLVIAVSGASQKLLTAFIVLSVLVPVLIYGILLIGRVISGKPVEEEFRKATQDKHPDNQKKN